MTTFIASTTAQVQSMVAAATGGDTVLLAPGKYDNIVLTNLTKSAAVNIGSLDSSNPAALTGMKITGCAQLNFSNLDVQTSAVRPFNVQSCTSVNFSHMDVHGILNGSSQDDGTNGLFLRNCTNVTVTDSHFHELLVGLTHSNSQGITISSNAFDLIGNDGIDGGGSSQITVSNNTFTNFDHVGAVHPDMIQFWTTNTTKAATDITVSGNVDDRGTGAVVQGIFIQDEVGSLPYQNVTITNNTIVGASFNALQINGAVNATVTGNVVIGTSDQASWIGMGNVTAVTMADNIATSYCSGSSTTITGNGDVLANVIALNADGSFPTWRSSTIVPASDVSHQAQTDILAKIALLEFTDGASLHGLTYDFQVTSLMGTSWADRLTAGAVGAFHLYGYAGDDTLSANRNAICSTLEGGTGNDTYTIYQTTDVVIENAGEGSDTVSSYIDYTLSANIESARAVVAGLTIGGNELNNGMYATAGGDTLYGYGGDDSLNGAAGSDSLYGGEGVDRLTGNDGDDMLDGGNGNDLLYGGVGNDVISCGAGNDYIEGGAGADKMAGGFGADTFSYRSGDLSGLLSANTDTITDFTTAEGDKIALTSVDANSLTTTTERFQFIGSQAFHGVAGELHWAIDGDGITVSADTNGDKVADFAIHLIGMTTITSSSFQI